MNQKIVTNNSARIISSINSSTQLRIFARHIYLQLWIEWVISQDGDIMGHTGATGDMVLCLVVILLAIPSSTEGTGVDSGNGNIFYSMHYSILHRIALYYIISHCIPFHCIISHCIALHCIASHRSMVLHCIALHCIALERIHFQEKIAIYFTVIIVSEYCISL